MKKMNLIIQFYLCSICIQLPLNAQFYEDFNTGFHLQIPKWSGDVQHFVINDAGQLQLKALQAGESSIFTAYNLPKDSIQVVFYLKMTFDPSDNNFTKIYLWADNIPPSTKNGYYLRLGENGSQDQIKFYKITDGNSQLLGAGKMAGIAKDPVIVRIRLTVQQNGTWRIETDYTGNHYFRNEMILQDNQLFLPDSGIFCIQMKYTTSRLDAFYVDDISIIKPKRDSVAPQLLDVNILDSVRLQLIFSEILKKLEAEENSNFSLNQYNVHPDSIYFDDEYPYQIKLIFEKPFDASITQVLECKNISDLQGNSGFSTYTFTYAQKPASGQIIINEILTDPYYEKGDFIELYNTTGRFLDLSALYLCNILKEESVLIPSKTILPPKQFLAICADTITLKDTYSVPAAARFCQTELPGLNISDAYVGISNSKTMGGFLDSVYYKESWHHPLLLSTRGISIERINPAGPSNHAPNWHSASKSSGFATPGYVNSVFQDTAQRPNKSLWLSSKSFTPVTDETLGILKINYSMEKSGYLATVFVFDSNGGPVCNPIKNELMGSEGFLRWDGLNENIQPVPTGIYVLLVNCFHADGDQVSDRFSVAVIR